MAKLKARGREEIFRVTVIRPPSPNLAALGVAEVQDFRALMTDGNILTRTIHRYTPEETAKNYGKGSHDYGWTVKGRARSGLNLEQLLKIYVDKGWEVLSVNHSYFRQEGSVVEALSQEPFITTETAEKRKTALTRNRARTETKRIEKAKTTDGPGYYVTNNYMGGGLQTRIADHEKPFDTYEDAEAFAVKRLQHFYEFDFNYLLPVIVIEAGSRGAALSNNGYVWWIDGKFKGPTVDPRQTEFNF